MLSAQLATISAAITRSHTKFHHSPGNTICDMPVMIVKYMAVNGSEISGAPPGASLYQGFFIAIGRRTIAVEPICLSSRRIFSVYHFLKMLISSIDWSLPDRGTFSPRSLIYDQQRSSAKYRVFIYHFHFMNGEMYGAYPNFCWWSFRY